MKSPVFTKLFRYGDDHGYTVHNKKLRLVTLGLGQDDRAKEIIKESSQTPSWVVLVNCHLVPEWMDELEYLCDDLAADATNSDFR